MNLQERKVQARCQHPANLASILEDIADKSADLTWGEKKIYILEAARRLRKGHEE